MSRLGLTSRPAALLLDAGDTLIFFEPRAVAEVLAGQGLSVAAERIEAALHPAKRNYQAHLREGGGGHLDGWSVLVVELLVHAGLAREHAERALDPLRRAHMELNFWRRVPAELPAALERARAAGLRLGVVSNSEGRLMQVLEHVGLARYFECVLDSQLEGVHKPDPEIFRRALARLGVASEQALYAGDIPEVDVLGARAAGMQAVLVDAFGYYAHEPAWPRVPSVAALVDELLRLPHEHG